MKISQRSENDIEYVVIDGDLRSGKDLQLLSKTVQGIVKEGKNRLVLDMDRVPYLDSAGLGSIIKCLTIVHKAGGSFKILSPSERVLEIFVITRMQNLLEWYGAKEELLKSYSE